MIGREKLSCIWWLKMNKYGLLYKNRDNKWYVISRMVDDCFVCYKGTGQNGMIKSLSMIRHIIKKHSKRYGDSIDIYKIYIL